MDSSRPTSDTAVSQALYRNIIVSVASRTTSCTIPLIPDSVRAVRIGVSDSILDIRSPRCLPCKKEAGKLRRWFKTLSVLSTASFVPA